MPRKAAAPADAIPVEPRRSSRIKDQPKAEVPAKKAPAKPRQKKTNAATEAADGDVPMTNGDDKSKDTEKPKSTGKKRTAAEREAEEATASAPVNGTAEEPKPEAAADGEKPASKRVCCPRVYA
jgi:hypothetical protein